MLVARLVMYCLCLVYVWLCLVMFGWGLVMFGQGAEFDFAEPFDFLRENGFGSLELAKRLFKIPYETCRLLIILGPFPAKGPQKYQKSIRFSTKSG